MYDTEIVHDVFGLAHRLMDEDLLPNRITYRIDEETR